MRAVVLPEPELDFGASGAHRDPRFGITTFGPVDRGSMPAPTDIRVGFVGPADGIHGARQWLERCRTAIAGKPASKSPELFCDFPGFAHDSPFESQLLFDESWERTISGRTLRREIEKPIGLATAACADLYTREVADLAERRIVDVVVVARPDDLEDDVPQRSRLRSDELEASTEVDGEHVDFHDLLKAQCISLGVPLQLVRSTTWDPTRSTAKRRSRRSHSIQDEATRAWNFHTAIYYKAGGNPWRMRREPTQLRSLFVGVSFFHARDRASVHTSVAQVFDERGEGVVVRGGPAARKKTDRQPHLQRHDADELLGTALDAYEREHHSFPARVVVHKTSAFDEEEVSGFEAAADARYIRHLELLWVSDDGESTRLFRSGEYPVLRGTLATIAKDRHLLYTRGAIDFYRLYPGMYIPAPLGLRPAVVESSIDELGSEVLALSKMNWNQSQMDGRLPITLRAARGVAGIMKYLDPTAKISARYASFM